MRFECECGSILTEPTEAGGEISMTVRCEDCGRTYAATISSLAGSEG